MKTNEGQQKNEGNVKETKGKEAGFGKIRSQDGCPPLLFGRGNTNPPLIIYNMLSGVHEIRPPAGQIYY